MTRAEQLQKEYEELTDKQATVIKDRDALKQVRLTATVAAMSTSKQKSNSRVLQLSQA